jgi:hypothetical protein
VPLAAAETFVSGGRSGVQTSKRSSAKRTARRVLTRTDGREVRRLTIYLPADLAKRLAVHCAEHDEDMSDVVTEALAKRLGA